MTEQQTKVVEKLTEQINGLVRATSLLAQLVQDLLAVLKTREEVKK